MSKTFPITLSLEVLTCVSCGCPFAVPETLLHDVRRLGGTIRCPRGHHNDWQSPEEKTATRDESSNADALRTELLRAVHRAEQAEARARDAVTSEKFAEVEPAEPKEKFSEGSPARHPEKVSGSPGDTAPAPTPYRAVGRSHVGCPCCNKVYTGVGLWLVRHMIDAHGWTREQAKQAQVQRGEAADAT
jgi:hypothetical protein